MLISFAMVEIVEGCKVKSTIHESEWLTGVSQNATNQKTQVDFTPDQKRLATLRAKAALSGHVLHAIEGDRGETLYIFSKWAQVRQLDSIEAAERWLSGVTGEKQ